MRFIILVLSVLLISCAPNSELHLKELSSSSYMAMPAPSLPAIHDYPENIRHYYLDNGLEVLTIKNTASPMVCLNMTIRSGAAYEDYSTSGMTHMLEHLLFNGTSSRTQEELYEDTDFYGIYSNAFTRKFYTSFFMLLPSEFILEGMDIQADMIFNSTLPVEKFEKERGIVIAEIHKDLDSDSYLIQNWFDRMNYGSTGTGLPTLGTRTSIEKMSRDEVYAFYKNHYVPNNMILTVIGNFEDAQLRDELQYKYGNYAPLPIDKDKKMETIYREAGQGNPINQTVMNGTGIQGQLEFRLPNNGSGIFGGLPLYAADDGIKLSIGYELLSEFTNEYLAVKFPDYSTSVSFTDYPVNGRLTVDFKINSDQNMDTVLNDIQTALIDFQNEISDHITDDDIALWAKKRQVENISLLDSPHYYSMMNSGDLAVGGDFVISKMQTTDDIVSTDLKKFFSHIFTVPAAINIVYPEESADAEKIVEINDKQVAKTILQSGATLLTSTGVGSKMFGMHILIKNRSEIEGELSGGAEILHNLLESGTELYSGAQLKNRLDAIGAQVKYVDMGFIPYDDYYNSPE